MTPIAYTIVITVLCLFALVFHLGIYYQKTRDQEEKQAVDILAILPYGFAGCWGLSIIITRAVL